MTDDLMERIEGCIANADYEDEWETLIDARDRIEALQADKAKLRETLKQIEASTYPRPLGKSWRMDLSSSKHDRCIHDEWMYDTCEGCLDDFIRKALQETGQ
jgi:hypothetical protein